MTFRTRPILTALALVALTGTGVAAQQGLTFGVRGGISVASASFDTDATLDKSNRTGYVGGVFLDYATSGPLGFQVGAQYTQKGVEFDAAQALDNIEALELGYFEIPAVLKLGLPLGVIRPSVFGGAGLSFNTGCEAVGTTADCGISSTDFMGIAGADLAIYLGGLSLWADARYHFGLQNLDLEQATSDLKNRNWTLQVGIGF